MSTRLSKIISHAKKFGFFAEKLSKPVITEARILDAEDEGRTLDGLTKYIHEYGLFGSLIRANLIEQWWKSAVTLQDRIYPLAIVDIPNYQELNSQDNVRHLPRLRALSCYQKYMDTIEDNEIGIAQITTLPFKYEQNVSLSRSLLNEYLSIHYFCPEKKATQMFNQFVKMRMRWWKKFANRQANFEQATKEESDKAGQLKTSATINHKFTFGKQTVEVISLGEIEKEIHFVECCTSVEQAMLTYLDDSLEEKITECDEDQTEIRHDVLRLHPNLSPVKLVILPDDADSKEQCDLVRRLSKEIKIAGIQCQSFMLKDQTTILHHADAIGAPFCLKIDNRTLQRGIISLRHRDTTIDEFMHISEVRETLSKILKYS